MAGTYFFADLLCEAHTTGSNFSSLLVRFALRSDPPVQLLATPTVHGAFNEFELVPRSVDFVHDPRHLFLCSCSYDLADVKPG